MATETDKINAAISAAAPLTLHQIIQLEIDEWKRSEDLKLIKLAQEYYKGDHAVLKRRRQIIGEGGRLVEDKNLSNRKLVHTFLRKLVDQKIGYLLSKKMSVQTENESYAEELGAIFDNAFQRHLKNVGKNAVNAGRGWLHPYYDESGALRFKVIPPEEAIPLWKDAAHTELDAFIRVYSQVYYESSTKRVQEKVEFWNSKGVQRFLLNAPGSAGLTPDTDSGEISSHFVVQEGETETPLNWERVPFICFKYNAEEIPLIKILKTLIDDYDEQTSDNSNNLTDLPNGIFVLKNYDGQDLGEFRKNLSLYRAVKVTEEGGVETLTLELNPEAIRQHIEQLRKDIYEFGRGVDTQSDKLGNSPSGIALKFLYSDLDMDANEMENEFQAALEQLRWFVDTHIANTTDTDYSTEQVDFIFNRDIVINETDAITNAKNSVGIISNETIRANHPWVTDAAEETDRIKKEQAEDAAFYSDLNPNSGGDPPGADSTGGAGGG